MGGGYFQFFTKNLPQKHQKRAILHTSQANGGLEPPPPPLATLLVQTMLFVAKLPHVQMRTDTAHTLLNQYLTVLSVISL